MRFCVLASGSRGNMTYIENQGTKILIDAGISFLEASRRAQQQEIDLSTIDAIFITHEHRDHIGFLPTLLKKTQAVLYISQQSLAYITPSILSKLDGYKVVYLEEGVTYKLNGFKILPILLSHDSVNCFGFIIEANNKRLFYATDTGFLPIKYFDYLKKSDAIIIESNHDIELLNQCDRPRELKNRILSARGHMSNYICAQILKSVVNEYNRFIILAHLSEECNSEEIALETIYSLLDRDYHNRILLASQSIALKVIEL